MAMTRRRTVTPEWFLRDEMLALPPAVRLTAVGLLLYADDHGRERVNQRLMLARIFPLDRDMTETTLDEHLLLLDAAGVIAVYEADGTFYQVLDWPRVDRPQASVFPPPPDDSGTDRESFRNHSWRGRESVREGEREVRERTEWEGESGSSGTDPDGLPPSPFCPAHRAQGGTDRPCRSCGTHRLRRKVYDDELMSGVRFDDGEG